MIPKKELFIDRKKFLSWYFQDNETANNFISLAIDYMKKGECVSIYDIVDEILGYIPNLCILNPDIVEEEMRDNNDRDCWELPEHHFKLFDIIFTDTAEVVPAISEQQSTTINS